MATDFRPTSHTSPHPHLPQTNSFYLGSSYNLGRADSLPTMEIAYSTAGGMTSSSKQVGYVRIPLETIDQTTETQDSEYTLRVAGLTSEQSGTVRVKLTWSSALDEESGGNQGAMSAAEEIVEVRAGGAKRQQAAHLQPL